MSLPRNKQPWSWEIIMMLLSTRTTTRKLNRMHSLRILMIMFLFYDWLPPHHPLPSVSYTKKWYQNGKYHCPDTNNLTNVRRVEVNVVPSSPLCCCKNNTPFPSVRHTNGKHHCSGAITWPKFDNWKLMRAFCLVCVVIKNNTPLPGVRQNKMVPKW